MEFGKIRLSKSFLYFVQPFLFVYSYILIVNYTQGDQTSYRALYESLKSANFFDVMDVSTSYVSASEWLTFYILWIPAVSAVPKDIFISCANLLLLNGLFLVLKKYQVNIWIIFLFLINFYVIVLMTGAERLKFSIIFLLISELVNNRKAKVFFAVCSVFAHLQTILFYIAIFFGKYVQVFLLTIKTARIEKKNLYFFLFLIIFAVFLYLNYSSAIQAKLDFYSVNNFNILELFQIAVIGLCGLYILKNRYLYLFSLFPPAYLVILIGGIRVNMIAFMVFVYFILLEKKQNHIIFQLLMVYFFVKSIPFVQNIFEFGNGFHGV